LLCWSYDSNPELQVQGGGLLHACILMFKASSMQLLIRVPMPDNCVVPYSVHSAIYSRAFNQQSLDSVHMHEVSSVQIQQRATKRNSTTKVKETDALLKKVE